MMSPVLQIQNLSVAFGKDPLQVTDRVSFDIRPGEFFALVGESGCGKSVTAMSILRLLPQPSAKIVEGSVLFSRQEGEAPLDLSKIPLADLRKIRGAEIACIFQEPMQALNPVITIKKQLLETFHFGAKAENPLAEIRAQLASAGFKDVDRVLDSYPHELSGGMLQRVCIVMALLSKPKLIIADEPTTALDVTVQAQVLSVLKEMARETHTAVLLITHNMGIVSQYADRVAVMYAGRIVETGPVRDVIENPMHPYTQGLLAAIPENHSDMRTMRSIPGSVPHPRDFAAGCRFADRCEKCSCAPAEIREKCLSAKAPSMSALENPQHEAACYLTGDRCQVTGDTAAIHS